MGKSQKKAAKIQRSQKANPNKSFNIGKNSRAALFFGWFSNRGKVVKVLLTGLLFISLVITFCYPSAKTYYTEMRKTQKYEAELAALDDRNAQLKANVEALSTDQGIEDKAKNDYGYVKEGEGSALVQGIERDKQSALPAYVDPDKIEVDDAWYTPTLDFIFGYSN